MSIVLKTRSFTPRYVIENGNQFLKKVVLAIILLKLTQYYNINWDDDTVARNYNLISLR